LYTDTHTQIPHNSTNLQSKCCLKHTWCNRSRASLVALGLLELEHVKYLNRPGLLSFGTTSAPKNFKQDKKGTLYQTRIQTQARLQGQINIDVVFW